MASIPLYDIKQRRPKDWLNRAITHLSGVPPVKVGDFVVSDDAPTDIVAIVNPTSVGLRGGVVVSHDQIITIVRADVVIWRRSAPAAEDDTTLHAISILLAAKQGLAS